MSADLITIDVLVDSGIVVHEVLIDYKSHHHWSIQVEFLHYFFAPSSDVEGTDLAEVLLVVRNRAVIASVGACAGHTLVSSAIVWDSTFGLEIVDRWHEVAA